MDKDRYLLPWILGGLSMVTVAIAITVGANNGIVPRNSQAPSQTTVHALPQADAMTAPASVPAQASASAPASAPAAAPTLAAAEIQTMAPPMESSGQVWECTINGQKTFSDHPCGDKSSLREIGPINGMDPSPLLPQARSYVAEPNQQPEYSYPSEQENYNPGEQPFAVTSYPVFVGIPFHERRRPDHPHRPHGRDRSAPPRNN